jgi:hypothetical protein
VNGLPYIPQTGLSRPVILLGVPSMIFAFELRTANLIAMLDPCNDRAEVRERLGLQKGDEPYQGSDPFSLISSLSCQCSRPSADAWPTPAPRPATQEWNDPQRALADLESWHFPATLCNGSSPVAAKCSNKSAIWRWWMRLSAAGQA